MLGPWTAGDVYPLYEHSSDYLSNMSALTRKEARRQWRESIKQAWNHCCAYCGKPPIDDSSLTIDHIRPKSKGGSDRTNNVTPACVSCNHSKASSDWVEWYREQSFYDVNAEWRIKQWLNNDYHLLTNPENVSNDTDLSVA